MNAPALQTAVLGKRFGSIWALRDCSLEIPAGTVAALVGPNGAGKTTLLHLAVGLSSPTEGSVSVLGASPRHVLPRIGFDGGLTVVLSSHIIAHSFSFRS